MDPTWRNVLLELKFRYYANDNHKNQTESTNFWKLKSKKNDSNQTHKKLIKRDYKSFLKHILKAIAYKRPSFSGHAADSYMLVPICRSCMALS